MCVNKIQYCVLYVIERIVCKRPPLLFSEGDECATCPVPVRSVLQMVSILLVTSPDPYYVRCCSPHFRYMPHPPHFPGFVHLINTLRTGDANLRHLHFLHYNYERQMTQICLLTHAWFLHNK
jgi:hypothetical protein